MARQLKIDVKKRDDEIVKLDVEVKNMEVAVEKLEKDKEEKVNIVMVKYIYI